MNKSWIAWSAVVVLAGCAQAPQNPYPLATPFQGLASDGKHYSMLDLSRGKPLLIVFYHADHKAAMEWAKEFAPIAKQESSWLNTLGVTTVPELDIPQWKQRYPDILPTIGDMDRRIMGQFKAEESVSIAVIAPDGTWRGTYKLLSPTGVEELKQALAQAQKTEATQLERLQFPKLEDQRSLLTP